MQFSRGVLIWAQDIYHTVNSGVIEIVLVGYYIIEKEGEVGDEGGGGGGGLSDKRKLYGIL